MHHSLSFLEEGPIHVCQDVEKLESNEQLTTTQPREDDGEEGGSRRRKENPEHAISELSIGSIIVLALLGLSLIACGILCTLKRCGPPTQVERQPSRFREGFKNPSYGKFP